MMVPWGREIWGALFTAAHTCNHGGRVELTKTGNYGLVEDGNLQRTVVVEPHVHGSVLCDAVAAAMEPGVVPIAVDQGGELVAPSIESAIHLLCGLGGGDRDQAVR